MLDLIIYIGLIVTCFVLSGIFSGSEMAYLSCNKLKLRHLADEEAPNAVQVARFHERPKRFLTMILIGNNLMHVALVGFATYLFKAHMHIREEWIMTVILSPLIIVFAETVPKDLFRLKADEYIYRFAPFLTFLNNALKRISDKLVAVTDKLIELTAGDLKKNPIVTREEFRYVIEESAKGGVLLEHEKKMINTILNLSSIAVTDVMISVDQFPKIPITSKIADVKREAKRLGADAFLVYEEIPSLIVGMLYIFDVLFEENEDQTLGHFLKAPLFLPHNTTAEHAIFLLQSKHASYGVVIGRRGEVIGAVELENLIQIKVPSRN